MKRATWFLPSYYGMDEDWPDDVLVTVTFEELEYCTTLLTLRHSGLPAGEMSEADRDRLE